MSCRFAAKLGNEALAACEKKIARYPFKDQAVDKANQLLTKARKNIASGSYSDYVDAMSNIEAATILVEVIITLTRKDQGEGIGFVKYVFNGILYSGKDKIKTFQLQNGETLKMQSQPGLHTLRIENSTLGSVLFDFEALMDASLECGARYRKGFNLLSARITELYMNKV